MGLTGWGWDDVLPFFRKQTDHFSGESEYHGVGGEWRIEEPRVRWDLLDAFRKAAEEYGIKPIDDFNRGDNEGSAYFHVNQRRGRRWSAARGFLKPVLGRPNLRVETGCLVERVETRRLARDRRALAPGRRDEDRALQRRGDPVGRLDRLDAIPAALRHRARARSARSLGCRSSSTGRASGRTCRTICSCA